MKNILSITALAISLFIANSASAQAKKAKKQEDPKKKEQKEQKDSTKASGTRMAINSSGLPTKGKKTTNSSNSKTVADPKTEPKKDEGKKSDEKK